MVLLIRPLVLLAVWLVWAAFRARGTSQVVGGREFFVRIDKDKERTVGFVLSTKTRFPARFSFDRERRLDTWMRLAGLVDEVQTNDVGFDDKVFVACDNEALHHKLKSDPALRTAIVTVLDRPEGRIVSDGQLVHLRVRTVMQPKPADFQQLLAVTDALDAIAVRDVRRIDPFFLRAAVVEVVFGTLLAYGLGGVASLLFSNLHVDLHFAWGDIARAALGTCLALTIGGLAFLALVVRHSSRAWRIVADGLLLLAVAVPTAGITLAVDLNRVLDGAPVTVDARVSGMHVEERRTRGSASVTWYASLEILTPPELLDPAPAAIHIPTTDVKISRETSNRLNNGDVVKATFGKGALGAPYWISLKP